MCRQFDDSKVPLADCPLHFVVPHSNYAPRTWGFASHLRGRHFVSLEAGRMRKDTSQAVSELFQRAPAQCQLKINLSQKKCMYIVVLLFHSESFVNNCIVILSL